MNIVVARYKEDISWITELKNINTKYIYNKSGSNEYIPLPNIGREAHTFLYHIVNNYDELMNTPNNITFFSQGKISDHTHKSVSEYVEDIYVDTLTMGIAVNTAINHKFGVNSAHYDFRLVEWPVGSKLDPEKGNLCFGDWFIKYIKPTFPKTIYWWVGAIFAAQHKYITYNSKDFYITLLNQFTTQNEEIAHYMERSWFHILLNNTLYKDKLLYVWSNNICKLKNIYEKSIHLLSDILEVKPLKLCLNRFKIFGFRTESWYHCLHIKILYIRNTLKMCNNSGEYIVCSDIDIQILKPNGILELIDIARKNDIWYYGMYENNTMYKYNGGFYILKACDKIVNLFDHIVELISQHKYPYGDQDVINSLLDIHIGSKHTVIPHEFTCWGNSPVLKTHIFHHAVCAYGLSEKLKQMNRVFKDFMLLNIDLNKYDFKLVISSNPKIKNYNRKTLFIYVNDSTDFNTIQNVDIIELDADIITQDMAFNLYNCLKYTGFIICRNKFSCSYFSYIYIYEKHILIPDHLRI